MCQKRCEVHLNDSIFFLPILGSCFLLCVVFFVLHIFFAVSLDIELTIAYYRHFIVAFLLVFNEETPVIFSEEVMLLHKIKTVAMLVAILLPQCS